MSDREQISPVWGVVAGFGIVALLAVAVAVVVLVTSRDGDEQADATGTTLDQGPSSSTTAAPTSTAAPAPPSTAGAPAGPVRPTSAIASSTLASQESGCTGEQFDYVATNTIDGDNSTAWAPRSNSGIGETIVFRFDQPVALDRVGLVPGYAKSAPLTWADCSTVDLFDQNRQVRQVRYTFDDGTSVLQDFAPDPALQWLDVSVTTSSVTLEVLDTELPAGENVDDDTLISEVAFIGS